MSSQGHEVVRNTEKNRFEVSLNGEIAVIEYKTKPGQIIYTHTEVPEVFEGQGVGSALVKRALDYAEEEGLEVVPQCPFVRGYLDRHPEYEDQLTIRRDLI